MVDINKIENKMQQKKRSFWTSSAMQSMTHNEVSNYFLDE